MDVRVGLWRRLRAENWCFWTVVLEKTLESLGLQGDPTSPFWRDQPWDFFRRNDAKAETPVLWSPHAKSWLIGKDSDAGRDWGEEQKGTTEDEMAGWMWVSLNSGSWWWTGRPGMLRFIGSQTVGHNWVTELIWSDLNTLSDIYQACHKISILGQCTKYSKYIIPKIYKFPVMIFSVFYKMMSSQISCYTFYPMLLSFLYWMRETGLITSQDLLGCLGLEIRIIKSKWYLLDQQPYLGFILNSWIDHPMFYFKEKQLKTIYFYITLAIRGRIKTKSICVCEADKGI